MKKVAILFISFFLITAAFGQERGITIGIDGGMGLVFLRNDMFKTNCKPSTGYARGIILQYDFPEIFSIRTGLAYERKGTDSRVLSSNTNYYSNGMSISYTESIIHSRLDYLTLPVLLRASYGRKIKYYYNAGLFFGYLVKQYNTIETTAGTVCWSKCDHRLFDVGAALGIGVSVSLTKNFLISLELRNNFGFYSVSNYPDLSHINLKTNTSNLQLGLLYKFWLNQKKKSL